MLKIVRNYEKFKDRTVGELALPDGTVLKTLERPWLGNQVDISCIPEGEYIVKRDKTGKHQYYAISDVPNRTNIEIHPANDVSQLLGCIALGLELSEEGKLKYSTNALHALLNLYGNASFHLVITS